MSKPIYQIMGGIVLFHAGIWGGEFAFHIMPENHWMGFPVFITTISIVIAGGILFGVGIIKKLS